MDALLLTGGALAGAAAFHALRRPRSSPHAFGPDPLAVVPIGWHASAPRDPVFVPLPETAQPGAIAEQAAERAAWRVPPVGSAATLDLRERSLLVSGTPGSGKTTLLRAVATCLASLPDVAVFVVDGKESADYEPLRGRVELVRDLGAGRALLAELAAHVRRENRAQDGTRHPWLDRSEARPVRVVIVDEVADLVGGISRDAKRSGEDTAQALSELVRLGRGAGYAVILATQRPTVDALPGLIRDNVPHRACLRVATTDAAKAALGDPPASAARAAALLEPFAAIVRDDHGFRHVHTPTPRRHRA